MKTSRAARAARQNTFRPRFNCAESNLPEVPLGHWNKCGHGQAATQRNLTCTPRRARECSCRQRPQVEVHSQSCRKGRETLLSRLRSWHCNRASRSCHRVHKGCRRVVGQSLAAPRLSVQSPRQNSSDCNRSSFATLHALRRVDNMRPRQVGSNTKASR